MPFNAEQGILQCGERQAVDIVVVVRRNVPQHPERLHGLVRFN